MCVPMLCYVGKPKGILRSSALGGEPPYLAFFFLVETGSHYVALADLELPT